VKSANQLTVLAMLLVLPTFAQAEESLDRNSVYRVNPPNEELGIAPQEEIKVGYVYKYFNPKFDRHVWGLAVAGGSFHYAFGPGSMQPAERFDLKITEVQKQQLFEERAPALSRGIQGTGRDIFARLGADDRWTIHLSSSIPKVFDLTTHRRWEWHGGRRVGVLHTCGPFWTWQDEGFQPMAVSFQ